MGACSDHPRLADHGDEIVSDDDFAHLYAPKIGRPSFPPSVVVRALLCAHLKSRGDDAKAAVKAVTADLADLAELAASEALSVAVNARRKIARDRMDPSGRAPGQAGGVGYKAQVIDNA